MGTSIHIVTEIRKNGVWQGVEEVPAALDTRNYGVFSILSRETGSFFNMKGFEVKGLPDDISTKRFHFESSRASEEKWYNEKGKTMLVTPDGKFLPPMSEICKILITEEEYLRIKSLSDEERKRKYYCLGYSSRPDNPPEYYVYNALVIGGKYEEVPYKDIYPTFSEYLEKECDDEWNEFAKDYGRYRVDFEDESFYGFNYLTLSELLNFDYSDYTSNRYKMDKSFYDKFIAAGGTFPDIFKIAGDTEPHDFADAIRESFCPTIIIAWQKSEEEKKDLPLFKGIEELKEIAKKYDIENYDNIRIIFAFDN